MPDELEAIAYHEDVNEVVSLMIQGYNYTEIARKLNMKRATVLEYASHWKNMASNNNYIQEQASSAITSANEHYNMAIKEFWNVADSAGSNGDLRLRKDSIQAAVTTEEKRIMMMQKAGLLTDQDLRQKLELQQQREHEIIEMLKEVAQEHPEIRSTILGKLARITNEGQGIEA